MSRRPLTSEERRLWAEIARSVAPLPGRHVPVEAAPDGPSPPAKVGPPAKPKPVRAGPSPLVAAAIRSAAPPLAPLERRTARALSRGRTRAEETLDLHGLSQTQAHARLTGFLHRSQEAGHGLVLVITGRGRDGEEGRGILRRMVPHWLSLPALRDIVLGFQEAGTRQGGAGALYVRLRRRRSGRST